MFKYIFFLILAAVVVSVVLVLLAAILIAVGYFFYKKNKQDDAPGLGLRNNGVAGGQNKGRNTFVPNFIGKKKQNFKINNTFNSVFKL